MKQIITLLLLLSNPSLFSDEYRSYDFEPIFVEKDFRIDLISKLNKDSLLTVGVIILNSDPFDYISNNSLFSSTDKGVTWNQIYVDTNERLKESDRFTLDITDVHYLSKDTIIAIYRTGYLLKSYTGGKEWQRDSIDLALNFYDSKFIDEKNGIILCHRNLGPFKSNVEFIRTTDAGQSWQEYRIPIDSIMGKSAELNARDFSFTKDGLFHFSQFSSETVNDSIVNNETYIVKTTDMGNTWEKILLYRQDSINIREPKTYKIISSVIQFTSKVDALWMGSTPSQTLTYGVNSPWEYPFLRKSNDGGKSWTELFYDQDSLRRSRSPNKLIKEDMDKYIFKEGFSRISVYEKGANKYVYIEPNNYKYINENFNYLSMTDFVYMEEEEFLVAGSSENIFKFNYSVPTLFTESLKVNNKFIIFPNPVVKAQGINIKLNTLIDGKVKLSIIDINGLVRKKYYTFLQSNVEQIQFCQTNNLSIGCYFLKIEYQNGHSHIQRFIVE